MSKRKVALWLVVLMVAFCGARGAGAVEITVGRLHEIDFVRLIKDIAPDYEAEHPDVSITVLDSEYENDLVTYQAHVGPLPDIFTLVVWAHKRVQELPYCVRNDLIVPVEELVDESFVAESDYFDSLWRCIEYEGKHWGIPFYAESYGVVLKNAAVPAYAIESSPQSWNELKQVFTDSTKDTDGDGRPETWGVAFEGDADLVGFWFLLAAQLGAKPWDGERFTVAGDAALRQAFDMLVELRDAKALSPTPAFRHAAGYVQNFQFVDEIERTNTSPPQYWSRSTAFTVIPFPTVGKPASLPVLNVYLAIRKTSARKLEACWDFVRYATSAEVLSAKSVHKMGYLPIHESVASSSAFQDRVAKMPHLEVFVNTLKEAEPFFPYVEKGNEAFDILGGYFLKALREGIAIEEVLSEAEEQMNALLEQR